MNKLLLILFFANALQVFGQNSSSSFTPIHLPEGYVVFDKFEGDLNNDGVDDCVLIIKGTDEDKWVINRFDKKVDRNRRGILVFFNNNGIYELAVENHDCFESENEDGGVYFPPELNIEIVKGNLQVKYNHGRYGEWNYIFRHRDSDFELIGFDSADGAVVIRSETSINFLTRKKLTRTNTNIEHDDGGEEIFKEVWSDIKLENLIKLAEIKDFSDFNIHQY